MVEKTRLETRTSKNGNEYQVLVLVFKNGYEKQVFLDKSEIFMIKAMLENNK